MKKSASARRLTRTEELLSAVGNEDAKPETKKPDEIHWQQILMACCCGLAIAAAGKDFLYLDTEISTVQSTVDQLSKISTRPRQR